MKLVGWCMSYRILKTLAKQTGVEMCKTYRTTDYKPVFVRKNYTFTLIIFLKIEMA